MSGNPAATKAGSVPGLKANVAAPYDWGSPTMKPMAAAQTTGGATATIDGPAPPSTAKTILGSPSVLGSAGVDPSTGREVLTASAGMSARDRLKLTTASLLGQ